MASSKEYLDFIIDQLSLLNDISYRPMMGEYIIYYNGIVVGGVYDDRFLLKKTEGALKFINDVNLVSPYPGAKDMIFVDNVDDKEYLLELVNIIYKELPKIKNKK